MDELENQSTMHEGPRKVDPHPGWTPQEKWVWEQVCAREIANFNEAEGYGGELNPKEPDGWPENRVLRPEFLEAILLDKPYRDALSRHGVQIIGAWFIESLDLSDAILDHPLGLKGSRFEKDVNLSHLRTPHLISLIGSKFTGKLDMNSLQVEGHLLMRGKAEFAEVDLASAKIKGQVSMIGSKFSGKLDMSSLQVEGHLFMRNKAEFAEVVLITAKIKGQLAMDGSKFTGKLDMSSLQVEGHLFMRDAEVTYTDFIMLVFSEIGGNLQLEGSILPSLDLTGTQIKGEFKLGSESGPAKWQDGARLILRNTNVGALQDLEDAWPSALELDGFTYNRLGGFAISDVSDVAGRDVKWFIKDWLTKQKEYSPQPYEQLASVLVKTGHKDKSDVILYASRERERSQQKGPYWLWSSLLKIFIGYGYRVQYSIIWILFFISIGSLVLQFSGQGPKNHMPYGIAYSVDTLLPIIELRELHDKIDLAGWARYYFYIHKIMGYILASFIIAGLSGLTKKVGRKE